MNKSKRVNTFSPETEVKQTSRASSREAEQPCATLRSASALPSRPDKLCRDVDSFRGVLKTSNQKLQSRKALGPSTCPHIGAGRRAKYDTSVLQQMTTSTKLIREGWLTNAMLVDDRRANHGLDESAMLPVKHLHADSQQSTRRHLAWAYSHLLARTRTHSSIQIQMEMVG